MNDIDYLLWIWLKLAVDDSSAKAFNLYSRLKSIKAIYEGGPSEYKGTPGLTDEDICNLLNKDLYNARETLLLCQENNIEIIPIDCERYPDSIRNLPIPPCLLFAYGNYDKAISKPRVTVIGSRDCTQYGKSITRSFCSALVLCGCTIVTGVAESIDKEACSSTLHSNGSVILIVPSGILTSNYIARVAHIPFANSVLISEHLPKFQQTNFAYPERNRLLAGLSVCCLVTQAKKKSGTLLTVNHALDMGIDVLAVPGNITDMHCEGTNRLFSEGAIPALSYKDVLDVVKRYHPDEVNDNVACDDMFFLGTAEKQPLMTVSTFKKTFEPLLDSTALKLLSLFEGVDLTLDYIVQRTKLPVHELLPQLSSLENAGAIISVPGNKYRINLNK